VNTLVLQQQEALDGLSQLGLTETIIREAILDGELARSSCTANDPPALGGILGWGRTTRGLRERTIPLGWSASEIGQLSTTVDPAGTVAIAVTTGDQGTGVARATPRTKYPKGPATAAAVERNRLQLDLFKRYEESDDSEPVVVTWLLLIARSGKQIRCELSLPGYIGDDDRVETWVERIILEPISTEPTPDFGKLDQPTEIDVLVDRKVS
jgi:hypothetical protein